MAYFALTNNASILAGTLAAGSGVSLFNPVYVGDAVQASVASDFFGMPVGIVLSSGSANPPEYNSSSGFTGYNGGVFEGEAMLDGGDRVPPAWNGDADLDGVLNATKDVVEGFSFTTTYDAASLSFAFTAPAGATHIGFDLLFGSDEYPEYANDYVDGAAVFVDGVNYAYFDVEDPGTPLSVLQANIDAGYFINNNFQSGGEGGGPEAAAFDVSEDEAPMQLPIEYDGISNLLHFSAPLDPAKTLHTFKVVVADSNDHVLDTAIFLTNMTSNATGSGIELAIPTTNGDDSLEGGGGGDMVNLGGGDDTFNGGGGNDYILGGGGDDDLEGGQGDDLLNGGSGDDTLNGGDGDDTYVVDGSGDVIEEDEGGGDDTVQSYASDFTLPDNFENLVLGGNGNIDGTGNDGGNGMEGNGGNNNLDGGGGNDTVSGGGGNDSLFGGHGRDRLFGDDGDDDLDGGSGSNRLTGGNGNDTYYVTSREDYIVERAGGGTDTVIASVDFVLSNNVENLTLTGTGLSGRGNRMANTLNGDDGGNDMLDGMAGNDTLNGNGGSDLLFGGKGNDSLSGGTGSDVLNGGKGNDVLTGGAGADFFSFAGSSGDDTITDWSAGDTLVLRGVNADDAWIAAHASVVGGNVVIDLGWATITLDGINNVGYLQALNGDIVYTDLP
jgi:Ca2+-binding RTX toxin-like protein